MEYISEKEFRKQPMEVQQVIFEWWRPSKGDLFENDLIGGFGVITGEKKLKNGLIPLLTEGQLRKFIEDNINKKVDIIHYINEGYILVVDEDIDYSNLGHDLLQAYWKVACEIAKEEVVEHGQTK
ncbi:hypothetical protein FDA09_16380 [Clostridium botulinum]|uniref:hypothetical protein n=1 Tax=Clostridium botulinum TaxID=1491 RepID=UPI000774A8DB|nr:hypothetical protein [Clostridium botulinum]NFH81739.1 hypothetical protein [Clostridium botulinum]NFH85075.1 hypothetical protein [Clostridium botulinum]NFH85078.1 hypothetical protein [Clostridium botulinum]NFI12929.1 hypothetical protein [Clostridium botulinum]NFI16176.1 hypothetical protein [Clostridium botulinum]